MEWSYHIYMGLTTKKNLLNFVTHKNVGIPFIKIL